MEGKVSDFKNHQRFSLRCLSQGVTPVSLRLKNLTRTQRGEGIIKRAERQLLNKRIRNINYKIERYHHDKCMYKKQLEEILQHDQEMWNACQEEVQKEEKSDTRESWRDRWVNLIDFYMGKRDKNKVATQTKRTT